MAQSLRAVDVGFDLREGPAVDISDWADGESVEYDGPDGPRTVHGTRDEIAMQLARAGYRVVTAHTPNGRDVRCEPKRPAQFIMQPTEDNYWMAYSSTAEALAALE